MILKSFCEFFILKMANSLRLAVGILLVREYGISQLKASRLVGVPQPLLNYALHGRRKFKYLSLIMGSEKSMKIVRDIASGIISGKEYELCDICRRMQREGAADELLSRLGETSETKGCTS